MNTIDVLGIDLGTTNSVISIFQLELGETQLLLNREGHRLTPSVVSVTDEKSYLVGHPALSLMLLSPKRAIYSIKRFIGRTFHDKSVHHVRQMMSYDIEANEAHKLFICAGSQRFTPVQLSAQILRKLKEDAEASLGRPIERAVVTVPAYFTEVQRQATKEAGNLIGLKVAWIISEPTAAALAYGLGKAPETVAVYDLGGGTFDISIVEINEGLFRVKATKGDTHLGGDDFDQAIVNWIVESVAQQYGIQLAIDEDPQLQAHLRHQAIAAKIALSEQNEVVISLDHLVGKEPLTLTRAKLEELVDDLIEQTVTICDDVLKAANLPPDAIKQVLLVGGQTRMPHIKAKLHQRYGWHVNDQINPDEVVARGAAVMGARLCGHLKEQVQLWDVLPLPLGVEVKGGKMEVIIPAGEQIPAKSDPYPFTTHRDGQERISFRIFQGTRPLATDNDPIGTVTFDLTTPRPKGEHRIEVTFHLNPEGILSVRIRDTNSDSPPLKKKFDRVYHLSPQEVETLQRTAKEHHAEDEITRQLLHLQDKVTRLQEHDWPLDEAKRLDDVQSAIQERDVEKAKRLLDEMREALEAEGHEHV